MQLTERGKVIRKETWIVLALYLLFFLWWYVSAYGLGGGDPLEYEYILGFPAWFFYSCIVGYLGISVILWLTVRLFFKDISFGEENNNE